MRMSHEVLLSMSDGQCHFSEHPEHHKSRHPNLHPKLFILDPGLSLTKYMSLEIVATL